MSNRSISGWLIAIVLLGVMVGIAGGAVMGGVAAFYVVSTRVTLNQSTPPTPVQVAAVTSAPTPITAVTNLTVQSSSAVIDTVKKVEPAVVTVVNELSRDSSPFGRNSPTASGSGVIIDEQGHIITNNHVVEGANLLQVIFQDGSKSDAKLVGADPVSDIAVIQVGKVAAVAPLGDSSSLQLGETVIAIGSPLGNYRGSVTMGVVSGLNRSVEGADQDGLIQTDAAINHGNSGGPLINLAGQVIGINTLVVRTASSGDVAEGLGFAIPSNTVQQVAQELIAKGKVEYPFIGISYQAVTPQSAGELNLETKSGLLVLQVTAASPAAQAGIQRGDQVLSIDQNPIDEEHSLRSILFKYKPGDTITLRVLRNGKSFQVTLKLIARPDQS